ncbi:MAG: hypothetical protein HWQ35_25165 [Nostoc sp. NMS1]|nr:MULTISPECIES: hypothetical protein [unclassified Nostoc]MBN3909704.1 hypothetical protein [Nostoc sp. NMS1]
MKNIDKETNRQERQGEAARSWGATAVLGVSPMSDCRRKGKKKGINI